jgi:hypothetical protein
MDRAEDEQWKLWSMFRDAQSMHNSCDHPDVKIRLRVAASALEAAYLQLFGGTVPPGWSP